MVELFCSPAAGDEVWLRLMRSDHAIAAS